MAVAPLGLIVLEAELAVVVGSAEPVVRVGLVELGVQAVQEALAGLAVLVVQEVSAEPAVQVVREALAEPGAQVAREALAGLAAQEELAELVAPAVAELGLGQAALLVRPKWVTAPHHRDQVPVLKAEDLAAATETTRAPVVAEAAKAWVAAVTVAAVVAAAVAAVE